MSLPSMSANYAAQGVDGYYTQHGADYVNPHFSGVRKVMNTFMDACGSGEVTSSLQEWSNSRWPSTSTLPSHLPQKSYLVSFLSRPELKIVASDPYTAQAYYKRTQQHCLPISFSDIAEDGLPSEEEGGEEVYDLVFCSFALHLAGNHLFGLLDQLSRRTRYLVIVAPHKNPHIKESWGFEKVDATLDDRIRNKSKGSGYDIGDGQEIVIDSVRLRLYKSLAM